MWRRAYLLLLAVRIYFALSPSYLHPDEIFQGPEVIAGQRNPLRALHDDTDHVFKASSSRILCKRPGSGRLRTRSAASSHYGLFTAFP
jgi:hypothetical protein